MQPPVALAPKAVLAWMDGAGYGVSLGNGAPGEVVLEVHNCVYRELARSSRTSSAASTCGTVCGMLGVDESAHTQTHQLSRGDGMCRHEFRL